MNSNQSILPAYSLVSAADGQPTIMIESEGKKIPLHSTRHPAREKQLLDNLDKETGTLIVLGVGLGYHLANIKEYIGLFDQIILVECLPDIDHVIQGNGPLKWLGGESGVHLICGTSPGETRHRIEKLLRSVESEVYTVLVHPQSMRIFSDYYNRISQDIRELIDKNVSNRATVKAFGTRYLKNALKNLEHLSKRSPVSWLFGRYNNLPGLVIASGPTLDSCIDHILRIREKIIIIAVDSALPVLIRQGIRPDLVVIIDPQPYVIEHLQVCEKEEVLSVCALTADPGAFKRFNGFAAFTGHPVCQLFEEIIVGDSGSIESGTGSVAGDALRLALNMGLRPLTLAGFDSCFLEHKIYARGTAYQHRYACFFQNRFSTVENRNIDYIRKFSRGFMHEGKQTRRNFIQYKQAIDAFVSQSGAGDLFHLQGDGLGLASLKNISPEDFESLIMEKGEIDPSFNTDTCFSEAGAQSIMDLLMDRNVFLSLCDASLKGNPYERYCERIRSMAVNIRRSMALEGKK